MSVRFFNPALTYQTLKPELDEAYFRVMNGGDLILRQDVEQFEKTLAEYVGTKYAVALNSGTDALYLALRALKIGQGDTVLVPSRTFVATAQRDFWRVDGRSGQTSRVAPRRSEGAQPR